MVYDSPVNDSGLCQLPSIFILVKIDVIMIQLCTTLVARLEIVSSEITWKIPYKLSN